VATWRWSCFAPSVTICYRFEYFHDLIRVVHDSFGLGFSIAFRIATTSICVFHVINGSIQKLLHILKVPQGLHCAIWLLNRLYASWPCLYLRLKHAFGILRYHVIPLLLWWHVWRLPLHVGRAGHRWERFQSILVRILNILRHSSALIMQHLFGSKHFRNTNQSLIVMLQIQSAHIIERLPWIDALPYGFGFRRLRFRWYMELDSVPGPLKMHFWWPKQGRRLVIRINEFAWLLVRMADVSV
jgi:hypothetical protein